MEAYHVMGDATETGTVEGSQCANLREALPWVETGFNGSDMHFLLTKKLVDGVSSDVCFLVV